MSEITRNEKKSLSGTNSSYFFMIFYVFYFMFNHNTYT